MNEFFVYKHTAPNGKVYIGITRQNPPQKRWQNGTGYKGNDYFTRSIKKHGWDNFSHEILAAGLSEEEAKTEEIRLIKEYKSNIRKYGYNISRGGESKSGTKMSERQRELIRLANKGKVVSEETRRKLSNASSKTWSNPDFVQHMREINIGKNNPAYGKHLSDQEKIKRKAKQVVQLDKAGNTINLFISLHAASEKTGVNRNGISQCCKGIYCQAGGFVWKYV